ncbi:hypothetical protein [Methanobrevibacter sp.]|uniref:hypothetical protein n=1 Tax=Methanobrevibacter sp. TaxID=66852 RepID=UPI0038667ACF
MLVNYSKIILVGCISAFVALLTSFLGVAGTIIGSVISSMLYNMLSEALEKPVQEAAFSKDFEWEVAYVFPLIVIVLIQILFILALLSEWGLLPYTFLKAYVSLQGVAGNNLYRLLGCALIIISVYPFVLKPNFIKKEHGAIIAFVGLIFLARGFADYGNVITYFYDDIFIYFDFPIAIVALVLLLFVIVRILNLAKKSEDEFRIIKDKLNYANPKRSAKEVNKSQNIDFQKINADNDNPKNNDNLDEINVTFKNHVTKPSNSGINESSENIHFESNDLLDDYKK